MLEKIFKLKEHQTYLTQELLAGLTTFMTMSYIIFVQPHILSKTGMDFGAVLVATCLASCLACWIMAFAANYPIGLAPGMGEIFFLRL